MKLRTRTIALVLSFICLLVSGCVVKKPQQSDVQKEIEQTLSNSINGNAAIFNDSVRKKARRSRLSRKVQSSLVPKISVTMDTPKVPEHRFDVSANELQAHAFFMSLVKGTSYDIVVDPDVKDHISLVLNQVTVPEAIKAVCDAYNLQYVKTDYGYRIEKKRLISRIYKVNYLNITRKGISEMRISPGTITERISGTGGSNTGGGGGGTAQNAEGSSVKTSVDSNFWSNLSTVLKEMVGDKDERRVVVNPESGMIYVKAYPEEQRYVSTYLRKIQKVMHRQVIIEAKVLEVHLDAEYQSGIQWKLLGLNLNGTTEDNGKTSTEPFNLDNFYSLKASSTSTFSMLMQLLNRQGRTEVLSSPHISTLNNQKAVIKVGEDRFFITRISSSTNAAGGSATDTISQDVDFTPFFSGIALDVTPEINSDQTVTLQIHPIVSTVEQDERRYTLNQNENSVPLAKSSIRESDSIVNAKSGQVVVIGGLMANLSRKSGESFPGVDQTPFKESFGRHNRLSDKIELVILLKPVIVNNDQVWLDKLHNAKEDYKKMRGQFMYTVGVGVTNKHKHHTS